MGVAAEGSVAFSNETGLPRTRLEVSSAISSSVVADLRDALNEIMDSLSNLNSSRIVTGRRLPWSVKRLGMRLSESANDAESLANLAMAFSAGWDLLFFF